MRFLFLILALAVQQTAGVYAADVPLHEWREIHHPDYEEDRGYFTDITKQPMTTWLFEEGTFVPAAKLTKTEKLSIVTNYMGTPEAMYRDDGEAVWTCELNSYGKVRNFQGGSKTDCPFRYQGQYEDAETGLYYNRFRYYSPEEGVYISQDPIGIEGSVYLYSYVHDTNSWVDIWGLNKNSNNEISHFGIYQITIDGEVYKYGKADLNRVTQAGFDNEPRPTRLHQQVRKLREQYPGNVIDGKVINDLGNVTTMQAKVVETATIQAHYDATGEIPDGNKKSFKPSTLCE